MYTCMYYYFGKAFILFSYMENEVGKNRIDSEFNSFYAECENLKQRLKVKHL